MNLPLFTNAYDLLAVASSLPLAGWDLVSFFENAREYIGLAGGGLLSLIGTAGVVWGGVLLIKKLMAGQQNQDNWFKIILLIIVGGALMVGGFALISTIASGGEQTIKDLGEGLVLPLQAVLPGAPILSLTS